MNMHNRVITFLICLFLQACVSVPVSENWPTDIPAQEIFIQYCQENSNACVTKHETEKHLVWIKRFYFGSILYPTGWNEMTSIVTATLNKQQDKINATNRLDKLGLRIVLEWAKDNSTRLIDSQMLAIWANALATSAEKNQQIEFIALIESDVEQILSGTLQSEEITNERYYNSVEDYDNF